VRNTSRLVCVVIATRRKLTLDVRSLTPVREVRIVLFEYWARLPYAESAVLRCEHLRKQMLNLGKMDLRIAAIGVDPDMTLVTRNTRDFGRIPGLDFEGWSK